MDYVQPPEGQEEGAGEAAQIKMYEHCAEPAVEDVLKGYNGTIFACKHPRTPRHSVISRGDL